MAKARKILKRAKAVKSICTVTKTMEMVATARYRKSHQRAVATKPFVDRLAETVTSLCSRGMLDGAEHPLLKPNPSVRREAMLVITSNRGLAGAYNSGVLKIANERLRQLREGNYETLVYVVGKRGIQYMRFRRQSVEKAFTQFDTLPMYSDVTGIADMFIDMFTSGQISDLEVAYTQFISSGRQKAVIAPVLPLSELTTGVQAWSSGKGGIVPSYELIPSADEILGRLLPLSVRMKIYQCFLDAAVSEQMMRIAAMRSATDAANDMIHSLTVKYNRMRQGQITTELAEIMGGRSGLEA